MEILVYTTGTIAILVVGARWLIAEALEASYFDPPED